LYETSADIICGHCVQSEDVAVLRQEIEKGQKMLERIGELMNDCTLLAREKVIRKDVR